MISNNFSLIDVIVIVESYVQYMYLLPLLIFNRKLIRMMSLRRLPATTARLHSAYMLSRALATTTAYSYYYYYYY